MQYCKFNYYFLKKMYRDDHKKNCVTNFELNNTLIDDFKLNLNLKKTSFKYLINRNLLKNTYNRLDFLETIIFLFEMKINKYSLIGPFILIPNT